MADTTEEAQVSVDVPQELHFAFVRPLGTDVDGFSEGLAACLAPYGFRSEHVKYSNFINELLPNLTGTRRSYEYYGSRMDAGDALREEYGGDVLAWFAVAYVTAKRGTLTLGPKQRGVAFFHDSLMHPDEISALRQAYGSLLFVVSLHKAERARRNTLRDRLLATGTSTGDVGACVDELINRDLGRVKGGSKRLLSFEATFHKADVFLDGTASDCGLVDDDGDDDRDAAVESKHPFVARLLRQIFSDPHGTPSLEERAMAQAYTAALGSGSLARRVGAALVSAEGDVCATGHNDVPLPTGGVADNVGDPHRDVDYLYKKKTFPFLDESIVGADSNDLVKLEMLRDLFRNAIADGIVSTTDTPAELVARLAASELVRGSQFFELFGYGRTVHAEMNLLTTAARTRLAVRDATLYTTTFPCHDCARHIVASGIGTVVYVEPYPKSRVAQLHADSIQVADDHNEAVAGKVLFRPFVGISYLRLGELYSQIARKQDNPGDLGTYGRAASWKPGPETAIRDSIVGNKLTQMLRAASIKEAEAHAADAVARRASRRGGSRRVELHYLTIKLDNRTPVRYHLNMIEGEPKMTLMASEHSASSHFADTLDFDATRYGVDVDAGVVDGERIGIMSALMCALVRRDMWPDADSVPRRPDRRNGTNNGSGSVSHADIDLTHTA